MICSEIIELEVTGIFWALNQSDTAASPGLMQRGNSRTVVDLLDWKKMKTCALKHMYQFGIDVKVENFLYSRYHCTVKPINRVWVGIHNAHGLFMKHPCREYVRGIENKG